MNLSVLSKCQDLETPLHKAGYKGYNELAKLLVRYGADVRAENKHGLAPVDLPRLELGVNKKVCDESS